MRRVIPGHHNYPRGSLIQAVYNPRPQPAFLRTRRQLPTPSEQCIYQRPMLRRLPRSRMHHHSRGLIHHHHIGVLVQHIQRNFLGLRTKRWTRRRLRFYPVPPPNALRRLPRRAIHPHASLNNQFLHTRPAQIRQLLRKKAVQPRPGVFARHDEVHLLHAASVTKIAVNFAMCAGLMIRELPVGADRKLLHALGGRREIRIHPSGKNAVKRLGIRDVGTKGVHITLFQYRRAQ